MDFVIKGILNEHYFPIFPVILFNAQMPQNHCSGFAIVDTGAEDCLIKRSVATRLGLVSKASMEVVNPIAGIEVSDYFDVGVVFDKDKIADSTAPITMGTIEVEEYPSDIIIGASVLQHCNFTYNGHAKSFELHLKIN